MKPKVSNLIPESEGNNFASNAILCSIADMMNLSRFYGAEIPEFLFAQIEVEN